MIYSLNSETNPPIDSLASPKSILVFCLKNRGFWTPAKPEDIDELCKALSLADSLKNGDIRVLQDLLK